MADTPAQAALRAAFSSKLSVIAQTLSSQQQQQARANIGAISSTDLTNALDPYLTTANAQATYLGINATAQAANQWATARTLSLTGDATGSVSINGASDASLPLTIASGAVTNGMLAASSVTFSKVNSGDVATQAEAEAGTSNSAFMTPLRVAQAIAALGSAAEAYITQTYHSGSNWYRVWSNGLIEQCITYTSSATADFHGTVSLLKSFSNTNYVVIAQAFDLDKEYGGRNTSTDVYGKTTSSVYCGWFSAEGYTKTGISLYCSGY